MFVSLMKFPGNKSILNLASEIKGWYQAFSFKKEKKKKERERASRKLADI